MRGRGDTNHPFKSYNNFDLNRAFEETEDKEELNLFDFKCGSLEEQLKIVQEGIEKYPAPEEVKKISRVYTLESGQPNESGDCTVIYLDEIENIKFYKSTNNALMRQFIEIGMKENTVYMYQPKGMSLVEFYDDIRNAGFSYMKTMNMEVVK